MALTGKSVKTYDYYRNSDEAFRKEIESIRLRLAGGVVARDVPPFPEFSKKYLGQEVFLHQQ